jgi:HNH endonuclease
MPCFYCGVRLRKGGIFQKTKDHVVPKSKGGVWTVDACLKCNQAKKDMSLEEFRALRGGIEFFGEMRERLVNEATSWIVEAPEDLSVVHYQQKHVAPQTIQRPRYDTSVDLSKIKTYTRNAKTKQERKDVAHYTDANRPPDLYGVRFGAFIVTRRLVGKWEVQCICGAIDHRSTKAVLNPANTFDACVDCRKPVGKLRSDIYKETGIEVSWEDCFQHIYGEFINAVAADMSDLPS